MQSSQQSTKDTGRNRKISRVWSLARDIGMTKSELYLAIESLTGKDKISLLNTIEVDFVCRKLNSLLYKQNRKKYRENATNRQAGTLYLPTPDQRELVSDYLKKLTSKLRLNNPELYLESICKRTFKKEYKNLNRGQVQRLIEALKSIYKRDLSENDLHKKQNKEEI